jgi:hypothetical protein
MIRTALQGDPSLWVVLVSVYALALLFLFPTREVTQPPGKSQKVWEVLLPGTAPVWNMIGGLVLIAWCYFVIQDFLIAQIGSPWIVSAAMMVNLLKAYAVPAPTDGRELLRLLLRPSWVWVDLAPAVLFVVNLFLVLRDRRRAG